MNIVRRTSNTPVATPSNEWDSLRVFRDMMRWDPFRELSPVTDPQGMLFVPDIDVKETPEAYVFHADIPGIKDKDLEITLTGNRVTIGGKREEEKREQRDRYFSCERSYGSFSRSFTLPVGADADHSKAELKDGVLTLTIPKKPEIQSKKIQVQTAASEKPKA